MLMSGEGNWSRPAQYVRAVTPSDSTDLAAGVARSLYIGGAGNIAFDDAQGTTISATAVAAGLFPVLVKRVRATGTTATGILALY